MDDDAELWIADLYEKCYHSIWRVCMAAAEGKFQRIPLVEDCVQEAFAQAILHYDEIKNYNNPAGWIAKVAMGRLRNELAKERRHARLAPPVDTEALDRVAGFNGINEFLRHEEIQDQIRRIYERLSPEDQQIFFEYFSNSKPAQEISNNTGKTIEAIRSRIKRIRALARNIKDNLSILLTWIFRPNGETMNGGVWCV